MARSPGCSDPAARIAASAAAAWLVVGVAVLALPAVTPRAPVVRAIAAHGVVAGSAWAGALRVYDELDRRARGFAPAQRLGVARVILEESTRAELAPLFVLAVIEAESAYDARAVSPAGAVGLMQLMPPTMREELALARLAATDPFDPVANVRAGVRYLGRLVADFSDLELALMAYNAGPNRIRRHLGEGGVPARLLGYPRDVLRRAARLAPGGVLAARVPLPRPAVVRAAHRAPGGGAPAAHALVLATGLAAPEDACVRLQPALPISRGRDRPRPVERTLRG